ncbi:hypothetical protein [Clostridium beijerinckii]|uniref:hypothetical protein n=1 Tax=Clostridium beijerinckii TaxID=1520 RepID=UPI00111564E1|nr:hypothetical protein [Clostridium beijerinckii]
MKKTFENELLKVLSCRLFHFSLSNWKLEHAKVGITCCLEHSAIFSWLFGIKIFIISVSYHINAVLNLVIYMRIIKLIGVTYYNT